MFPDWRPQIAFKQDLKHSWEQAVFHDLWDCDLNRIYLNTELASKHICNAFIKIIITPLPVN